MIRIDVRGMDSVQAALSHLATDQIPYATMTAINTVAFRVKNALQAEMRSVFDRPTPWLLKQVTVRKATKQSLTAVVGTLEGIQDEQGAPMGFSRGSSGVFERYLAPHVEGGARRLRPAEHRLQEAGILPNGWYAVTGRRAPTDAYGNLSGAWWMMILSWLNAANWYSQGAMQNRAEKTSTRKNKLEKAGQSLFAVIPGARRGRLKPGVYLKKPDRSITLILLFVQGVRYQKRLDWIGIAQRTVETEMPDALNAAIKRAIETAR